MVILSRNDPVSGMRVFRSAQHYGLAVERGVFTRGTSPWRYLRPLSAHLFLSANEADVRSALGAGVLGTGGMFRGRGLRGMEAWRARMEPGVLRPRVTIGGRPVVDRFPCV